MEQVLRLCIVAFLYLDHAVGSTVTLSFLSNQSLTPLLQLETLLWGREITRGTSMRRGFDGAIT